MSKTAYKWMPVVATDDCMGCGLCAKACPPACLEMVWDFATLTRPEDCTSCNTCKEVCPHGVIEMEWVRTTGSPVIGRWSDVPEPAPVKPKRSFWGFLDAPLGSGA